MPSDGKTPLTAEETAIIKWWIDKVASNTDKKLVAANAPEEIKQYISGYFGMESSMNPDGHTATNIVAPPISKEVIEKLKVMGFAIKYLNFKPDLLDVTIPGGMGRKNIPDQLQALLQVKDNIIWLNVADNNVSDNDLQIINQFKNLERLRVDKNPITDKGVSNLKELKNLKSINLHKTNITKDCFASLSTLTALEKVYVWNTGILPEEVNSIKSSFHIVYGYNAQ
jgi:hypothetical protein